MRNQCPILNKCPFISPSKGHKVGNRYRLDGSEFILAKTKYCGGSTYKIQLIELKTGSNWGGSGDMFADGITVDLCCRDISSEEFFMLTGEFYYRFVLIEETK